MNYWWINSKHSKWSWIDNQKLNVSTPWDSEKKNGTVLRFFKLLQKGDLFLGYDKVNLHSIVCLGNIDRGLYYNDDHPFIDIIKTKNLRYPLSLKDIFKIPAFKEKFQNKNKMTQQVISLSLDEYNRLQTLISILNK